METKGLTENTGKMKVMVGYTGTDRMEMKNKLP